jgi:hypothetical protein
MSATPYVANEVATGTTGSDGLAVFTFGVDIDASNHEVLADRLPQGFGIDYTVTGTRQVTFIAPSIPIAGAKIWLKNGVAGVTGSVGLPSWPTVAQAISDAAIELGIAQADIADPFASTDPNVIQLVRLLKSGGRDMVKRREWTHLVKEYTFNLVAGQAAYPIPTDFRSMVPDSQWDRSTRFPLEMPISSQDWQFLKAVPVASNIVYYARLWQSQIQVTPTPGAGVTDTMAFEYNSNAWIMPNGQTTPTSDAPSLKDDVICFEPRLVVARLKRDWRRNKKQDSQAEEDDYQAALFDAENGDSVAKTIYIGGGRSRRRHRMLDRWNLPDVIR